MYVLDAISRKICAHTSETARNAPSDIRPAVRVNAAAPGTDMDGDGYDFAVNEDEVVGNDDL